MHTKSSGQTRGKQGLRFLVEAGALLGASLDDEATLRNVAQLVAPSLADWCTVHLVTPQGTLELVAIAHGDPRRGSEAHAPAWLSPPRLDQPESIAQVVRTGQALLHPVMTDALLSTTASGPEHLASLRTAGCRSSIVVPLLAHGRPLGALSLFATESRPRYDAEDLALVEELGRRVGSAVENARLYRAAQEARATEERLHAVTAALAEALTPAQVARAIIEEGLPSFGADAGSVYALADEGTTFALLDYQGYAQEVESAHVRVPVERAGPLTDAVRSGALVVVESAEDLVARWPYLATQQAQSGDAATMAAPLVLDGRVLGVLYVAFRTPRRFSAADRSFVLTLARQCAQALDHARLYEAERQARTQAEAAQGQLSAIFDAMADGVFVFGEGGSVLRMNSAARAIFAMRDPEPRYAEPLHERGYSTQVRDDQAHALPEQAWPLFRVLQGEVLTGASATDLMVRTADGQDLELSVSGAPMRDAQGHIIGAVCVVRDVTERRRLERRTHDALTALLRMAEALVLDPDDRPEPTPAGAPPARPQMAAQRLADLTCQVLGCRRVVLSAVDPATGRVQPVVAAGLNADQERRWREGGPGARLGEQITDRDVGQRLEAGEVLVLDTDQPPLRGQPNPYGVRTFLLAPMRIGTQFVGVLSLDHGGAEHTYTPDEQALAGAAAKLAALVLERERLLRERAEARANELALRAANQRMDEFLNIASHELKTPLTSLKATVQLAQRRLRLAAAASESVERDMLRLLPPVQDLLSRTDRQMARMGSLINDLLDISRIESGHLALRLGPYDLAAIVEEAVEEHHPAWPERTITLARDDAQLLVIADPERLAQVVTNYLTNALKYSAADQPVTVTVRREGNAGWVGVTDHGPGIPPADQEHIWERFYRVAGVEHRSGSGLGLGLGLYISNTIIARHQGRVGVASEVGQGSTFWFSLPLAPPAALPGAPQAAPAASQSQGASPLGRLETGGPHPGAEHKGSV